MVQAHIRQDLLYNPYRIRKAGILMKTFTLLQEVVHIPTKKKGQVITTKVDREGKQMVEVKYENRTTGWSIPEALTNFIQDGVDHTGEFLSD
jgi:hypothetical protein